MIYCSLKRIWQVWCLFSGPKLSKSNFFNATSSRTCFKTFKDGYCACFLQRSVGLNQLYSICIWPFWERTVARKQIFVLVTRNFMILERESTACVTIFPQNDQIQQIQNRICLNRLCSCRYFQSEGKAKANSMEKRQFLMEIGQCLINFGSTNRIFSCFLYRFHFLTSLWRHYNMTQPTSIATSY